jgi:hypothetical protein
MVFLWNNEKKFEDTIGIIRGRNSKKDRQHREWSKEKDKQRCPTKHFTEN